MKLSIAEPHVSWKAGSPEELKDLDERTTLLLKHADPTGIPRCATLPPRF
ncbi:MAG TPA: hypothetical protein VI094_14705 [Propionibacteriaceae bacterium]